jgi:hypothetical protein
MYCLSVCAQMYLKAGRSDMRIIASGTGLVLLLSQRMILDFIVVLLSLMRARLFTPPI